MTLDADLQSSRVSSRGHFSNSERVIQQDVSVSTAETCEEHQVYVQDTPDLVNSIAVRVDIRLQNPHSSPVLDVFSPTAWEFFVSVTSSLVMFSLVLYLFPTLRFVCFRFRSRFLKNAVLTRCVTATWC